VPVEVKGKPQIVAISKEADASRSVISGGSTVSIRHLFTKWKKYDGLEASDVKWMKQAGA
jgi:hypothetical protein